MIGFIRLFQSTAYEVHLNKHMTWIANSIVTVHTIIGYSQYFVHITAITNAKFNFKELNFFGSMPKTPTLMSSMLQLYACHTFEILCGHMTCFDVFFFLIMTCFDVFLNHFMFIICLGKKNSGYAPGVY